MICFLLIGAFMTLWRLDWNDSISGYKISYRKVQQVNMPLVVKFLIKDPVQDPLTAGAQKITTSGVLRKDPFLHDFLVMVNILLFESELVYFE